MDFKALIRRRASYKSKLTQFKSYLDSVQSYSTVLTSVQLNELNIRVSKLDDLYAEYDSVQTDLENTCEIPDEQYKERETFETQYYSTIAAARDIIDKQGSAGMAEAGTSSSASVTGSGTAVAGRPSFKLPVIHLPTFSGRYQDWLGFHDSYTSLIHNNTSIPAINKFHYLRAALKDSAASIIQSIDFSADNYVIAWQLLCERFHNNRLLVNNHIQSIFNIESINKESAKALRNIIDTVNKNLRALKILKLPTEHWDVLIIHIVSNKLDSVSCREWEFHRSRSEDSIPTLAQFNAFLKGRADLLETIDEQSRSKRRHSDSAVPRNKAFVVNSSETKKETRPSLCAICKHNHPIFRCYKFKSMPVVNRIDKVKTLGLCLNCLRSHGDKECRLGHCTICLEKHNTLLHQNTESKDTEHSDIVLSARHTQIQHESTYSNNKNTTLSNTTNNLVLLSTAVIQVSNPETKHTQSIRVLLDNGSTTSFISERLTKQLNLKTFSTRTTVEGLNNQLSHISNRCKVTIQSKYDNTYKTDVDCFVVPQIAQSLPSSQFSCITLNIPSHIQLADPTFNIPSQVDMLLGADIFWDVLGSERISLGKAKPTLSETRLGWLVSGAIHTKSYKNHTNTLYSSTVHCHHIQQILKPISPGSSNLTQLYHQRVTPCPKNNKPVRIFSPKPQLETRWSIRGYNPTQTVTY